MYTRHKEEVASFVESLKGAAANPWVEMMSEPFDINTQYSSTWPNNELPGVYLFLSDSYELLYVGKSTLLGARFSKHFHYSEDKRSGVPVTDESKDTRYIMTIGLRKEFGWLAPSLEEFLIAKLKPLRNEIGNS
jgi:excinuclease UvrABC nuclease subunit